MTWVLISLTLTEHSNIKFEVMVDFIQSDQAGIIIVTNKAAALLDLWTIK